MKDKLATILCLGLLFSPKSFSHAKTGNFSLGVHTKTSYIINADKALRDYYLFRDAQFTDNTDKVFLAASKEDMANLLKISKTPIVAGINFEYSTYFTDKFGLSFHGNWGLGNILVVTPVQDKFSTIAVNKGVNYGSLQNDKEFERVFSRKISIMDLGCDMRGKYDIINSSLDFNDYSRNSLVGSVSLGFKNNWLILREFCSLDSGISKKNVEGENDNSLNKNSNSTDRINCWFPGVVLGIDIVWGWNLGVGFDICYFFRDLFTKDERLAEGDAKYAKGNTDVLNPTYQTRCHSIQGGLRLYYDFGAFFNNHEAPSEIDIEKW